MTGNTVYECNIINFFKDLFFDRVNSVFSSYTLKWQFNKLKHLNHYTLSSSHESWSWWWWWWIWAKKV